MKSFKLTVADIESELYKGDVKQVTVPASAGEMSLLANHTPCIVKLNKGKLIITDTNDTKHEIEINSGALEFADNECNIIVFKTDEK